MILNTFCRLGLVFLALSLAFSGCKQPTETIVEVPVEAPEEVPTEEPNETPEEDGEDSGSDSEEIERLPEITGFTLTQVNPLRTHYAVKGKTVGRISNPVGGTAPFTYALSSGDGSNDTDNRHFAVSGDLLKIQADRLAAGVYFIHLKVTDSEGASYAKATTVTVYLDPAALDQETRMARGTTFKMRYVPSGAFMAAQGNSATIPTGFWMAETEVTQELYQLVMGENPSLYKASPVPGEALNRRPVDNVSWYDALLFCNRLSVAAGREPVYQVWGVADWDTYLAWAFSTISMGALSTVYIDEKANGYRLPSKNEWFWAAIGADRNGPGQVNLNGMTKRYSGGPVDDNVGIDDFAWRFSNSANTTHEVGLKLSNELGIFDMSGNIAEWTWERGLHGSSYWQLTGSLPLSTDLNSGGSIPYDRFPAAGIRLVSNQ